VPEEAEFLADNHLEESGQVEEVAVALADKAQVAVQAAMGVWAVQDNLYTESTRGSNNTMLIDYNNLQRRMLPIPGLQYILLSEKLR